MLLSDVSKVHIDGIFRVKQTKKRGRRQDTVCHAATVAQLRGNKRYDKITQRRFNPLTPSGYYMYHQFNIQQFYVLPPQCIYVLCVDLRTNSDYFPI